MKQPVPKRKRIAREDLKPGDNLCDHCTAKCCRYFALPIDTPETWEDYDHLRWYMFHGRVSIFVEEDTWYLMVFADCQHLQDDFRCGVYHDRPSICRAYSTDNCEYDGDTCYEKIFETADQIWEYAEAVLPPRPKELANPNVSLPVLNS